MIRASLFNAQQAMTRLQSIYRELKPHLIAGHRFDVQIKPEKRSDPQNRALHAWIGEIAAQIEWAGAKRDPETWKRLLVASWLRARGESIEILPALDGHGVDFVFRRTSTLTKAECAELLDYVQCWAAEHFVNTEATEFA